MVKLVRHKMFTPIRSFFKDSRATGVLLIVCTILSLLFSNLGGTSAAYVGFWHARFFTPSGIIHMPNSPLMLINEVLMSFFFFLVGIEIKRELKVGELASVRKSMLPVLAALGGMIFPAIIFTIFNGSTPFHHGWGIPMATDIAFSLGILSLLGRKIPVQLKIFLMALAIIDDLGAVVTIAIFYSNQLNFPFLIGAATALVSIIMLNVVKVRRLAWYILPAILLWYCIFNSGINATIAGVILAFCMPLSKMNKLEQILHAPVNFFIMPLFALANTAIVLTSATGHFFTSTISLGIILGLVFGKPLGIFLFSFLAAKSGIATLPSQTSFKQLFGIGMLGGIGFTMSIFTATLAYQMMDLQVISKIAIIAGSVISGSLGYLYLTRLRTVPAMHVVKSISDSPVYEDESIFGLAALNEPALI